LLVLTRIRIVELFPAATLIDGQQDAGVSGQ
jgi:hypothetical protein